MSTATNTRATTRRWLSAEQMRAMGFTPGGPEIDYGTTWGERHDVRVSFAPHRDRGDGYLYAHDPGTDRYLILAAQTTPALVEPVWLELLERTASPDGYLALAGLCGIGAHRGTARTWSVHRRGGGHVVRPGRRVGRPLAVLVGGEWPSIM